MFIYEYNYVYAMKIFLAKNIAWLASSRNELNETQSFVLAYEAAGKILDCLGDLLLSGYRIHGHLKTSQGGHLLTNQLLRELFSNDANWKFETLDAQNKEIKDNTQQSSIAVNA